MNDLVSFIVPVYNVEAYLKRCVESILGQTYENLQIILVNDGSQDNSGEICDDYAKKHPRIEVIHQANGGLSAARNTGIEHAKGEWIAFVDSDDYISKHFTEQMLTACITHGADISVCDYITDYNGSLSEDDFKKAKKFELITGREATLRHFNKSAQLLIMSWGKLTRASLWKELRFPAGKINEDVFVSHHLMYNANNIIITNALFYAYYQSSDSIMRRPFALKRLDVLYCWYEGVRLFDQVGETEFADIARRVYLNRLFDGYGLCKKFLPDERDTHNNLWRQAVDMYNIVKHVRSYIDLTQKQVFMYRIKQFVGRYCPILYYALFLRNRTYI